MRKFIDIIETYSDNVSWFAQGTPVEPSINDDSEDILEPEEYDFEWRLCDVPVSVIDVPNPNFHDEERMVRLRASENHDTIILVLTGNRAKLLDGSHRLKVALERGNDTIKAIVGKPV